MSPGIGALEDGPRLIDSQEVVNALDIVGKQSIRQLQIRNSKPIIVIPILKYTIILASEYSHRLFPVTTQSTQPLDIIHYLASNPQCFLLGPWIGIHFARILIEHPGLLPPPT